jgi:hypothetical protein
MPTIYQPTLIDLQYLDVKTEILTDAITRDTIEFLSKWNQVGDLHRRFIQELARCYVDQLIGPHDQRTIWPAHPGLGKTTCLRFFILTYIKYLRRGSIPQNIRRDILVCSNQVLELEDHIIFLREQLSDDAPEIGLYHQKQDTSQFKRRISVIDESDSRSYPILFATQNLIRRRGEKLHRSPDSTTYVKLGQISHTPNGVRMLCWDEEAIATKASHVNIEALRRFRRRHEESGDKKLDLFVSYVIDQVLTQIDQRHIELESTEAFNIQVPKLDRWDADAARAVLNGSSASREYGDNYLRHARQLATWQGDSAVIHFNTNTANGDQTGIVMDYVIEVPSELSRAVVTDASASTNKLIQLDKNLKQAPFMLIHGHELKRYDNVRLYVQTLPSGRASFLEGDRISTAWKLVLLDVVPKIRAMSPPGQSLIITFKGSKHPDQHIKEIQNLLAREDQTQLHFTTYGKHRGDNQWSHCTSVILAGTFHRDEGELSSLARSQTRQPLDDHAQPFTTRELVHSQTASDIQQALARGCCREVITVGGVTQAKPMNAFMGLSKRELPHVIKHLRDCFPGIQIYDMATGDQLAEEALLSMKAKVEKSLIDYLTITDEMRVKSKTIKSLVEEVVGFSFSAMLWSSAQKAVHVPGWSREGHCWVKDQV